MRRKGRNGVDDDAIHYATMNNHGIRVILSNDRDFDKIGEIERIF
ncbi:PIN domain-containing protein [Thermococcus sp. 21S7]|nr:PIN domain-containing protein [Thermococcus sp. 21S7]NJE60675.1 PIN domain-containing protein [Thermococcus sp. 21S7]